IGLARRLLAERQDALGSPDVDDNVVTLLEAPHDAADELTHAVFVFVEDEVAFGIAHALEKYLLRCLRGDAAERGAPLLQTQQIAVLAILLARFVGVFGAPEDLEAELLTEGRIELVLVDVRLGDLALRIGYFLDYRHVLKEIDLPGLVVEPRLEL